MVNNTITRTKLEKRHNNPSYITNETMVVVRVIKSPEHFAVGIDVPLLVLAEIAN